MEDKVAPRSKKKMFLHIGLHKTGTTHIQSFLGRNSAVLKKQGILYPSIYIDPSYQHRPVVHAIRGTPEEAIACLDAIKAASEDFTTVVLSSEGFSEEYERTIPKAALLREKFDVSIIIYLRRQDLLKESIYKQICSEWWGGTIQEDNHYELNHLKRLEFLERYFEGKIIVRVYEKQQWEGENIIFDFLKIVGGEKSEKYEWRDDSNISLPAKAVHVLSAINRLSTTPIVRGGVGHGGELKSTLRTAFSEGSKTRQFFMSPQERRDICDKFRVSNLIIARRYFRREVLFIDELDRQEIEWAPPLEPTFEEMVQLVHSIWDMACQWRSESAEDQRLSSNMPVPPRHLIKRVHGLDRVDLFLRSGRQSVRDLRTILSEVGRDLDKFERVLDFGCGCARTIRWLLEMPESASLFGTDIDPEAIEWCQNSIRRAKFTVNSLEPPSPYADSSFDLVFLFSVFTHLDEGQQSQWLRELVRITRQKAVILITTHGECARSQMGLSEKEQAIYDEKGFVYRKRKTDGRPDCYGGATHSREYALESFSRYFEVLGYFERGLTNYQDVVVLSHT